MSITIGRAAAWLEWRAKNTPMPETRAMFEMAAAALREKYERENAQTHYTVKADLTDEQIQDLKNILSCGGGIMVESGDPPSVEIVPRWIPVTERLPEALVDVLSFCENTETCCVDCVDEGGKWYTEYKYCDYCPTHWMPLPEPPKGE